VNRVRALGDLAAVIVVGLLALGPALWSGGYVLVGDMSFVPDQPWKSAWLGLDGSVPRAVPADAVVSVVGQLVPGDILQKAILLGILVFAGLGMVRVAATLDGVALPARLGGAVLYVWNPYVFERLAIGHWGLLIGYAALPWVLAAALDVRRDAGRARPRLMMLLAVAAIGSPTGGLVAGLVAVVVVADLARWRRTLEVVGFVVLVNLPWLTPALVNDAATSDGSGVAAFAARSDTPLGAWGSLLTFGGIWKQSVVPGERGASLLVVFALVLTVAALAALVGVARRRTPATTALAVHRLLVLAALGLVLAGLPATGAGERFTTFLVTDVPGMGLLRDSQKWLLPFVLVVCLGVVVLLDALGRQLRARGLAAGALTGALALLPVALLPSLAWGLSGKLHPVEYPAEWRTVRTILEGQPASDRRVVVLPWSAYQRLPWNDRRAALDPAIRYFPGQVITNEDLVVGDTNTVQGDDERSARIGRAIADGAPIGPVLADLGVRYVLVEKTAPGSATVAVPSGAVLYDGRELRLVDLGNAGRISRSPHPGLIVAGDAVAAVGLVYAGVLLIRRKPGEIG
jgi:hypothetical protein